MYIYVFGPLSIANHRVKHFTTRNDIWQVLGEVINEEIRYIIMWLHYFQAYIALGHAESFNR